MKPLWLWPVFTFVSQTQTEPCLHSITFMYYLFYRENCNDGNTRCFRNRTFLMLKRAYFSRSFTNGRGTKVQGKSITIHAKQNNSHKNQETWRVRKTNALWIFSQIKIKCSGQLSLRTAHIHPPVISVFYSADTSRGLFCPAYTGHFNSRI